MKNIELLSNLPLFEGISKDDIPDMLKKLGAYLKKYKKNEYIKFAGDSADFIGIILNGSIMIVQDDYYGNRNITATFTEGALFGEAFACAGIKTIPVDIIASSDTEIMYINCDRILVSCDRNCQFHHILIGNLLKIVANKNILLNKKLQYSAHKTTCEKVMAYLSDQARANKSAEFIIPFDRQVLADYLGVERSALSTEINKLAKQGIIETRRSYFKILKK